MIRDKYRIDAFIATGSMAMVYAATHRNGSRVALKILHRDLARDPGMAERFKREGYFANSIHHAGVVRAIDDDVTEDGCAFIVMELLEGENLEQRRERLGGRMPVADALQIGDAVLDVLSAAHDHEILHRDLKPGNVFITRKDEVKLLDFGVARFNDGRSSSDMTAVGMVLGTPDFMPPEQALGRREDVDARSDLWALGATLFTVMTGKFVHTGTDAKSKLIATARTAARPIREVMPELPQPVAAVIDRALAFDRGARWANAKAMREALVRARQASGVLPSLDRESVLPATRRPEEDAPTLARKVNRVPSPFDETVSIPPVPSSDGVYTSAPPVTRREEPPAAPAPEAPAYALRSSPPAPARPSAPSTERTPHGPSTAPFPLAAFTPAAPPTPPGRQTAPYPVMAAPPVHYTATPMHRSATPSAAHVSAPPPAFVPGMTPRPPFAEPPRASAASPASERRAGGAARVLVPLLIGVLAAAATYVAVARGHHLRARFLPNTMQAP
jgi:serine/threonine-protein kinase